jgi:hypothetical protein
VLKRNFLSQTGPGLHVLANGVNSSQTKSIFVVHTISRDKYPFIFTQREKYTSSFFDINCKNVLEFAKYDVEMEIKMTQSERESLESIKINGQSFEIPKLEESKGSNDSTDKIEPFKLDKILENASQTYLELLDEKVFLVLLKVLNLFLSYY